MIPIQLSSGSPSQVINNNGTKEDSKATPVSSKQERVIPIKREGEQLQVRKNISGSLIKQLNGNTDTSRPTPTSRQGENEFLTKYLCFLYFIFTDLLISKYILVSFSAAGLTTQEVEEKSLSKSPLKPALPVKPTQTTPPKQPPNKQINAVKVNSKFNY